MYSPSKERVEELLADYGTVPVSREILSDVRTPMEVMSALLAVDDHCFILESIEDRTRWGRYTIIGFQPEMDLTCTDGTIEINEGGSRRAVRGNPSDVIRGILAENRSPAMEDMPPFTGGLVGYFSYDYIKYSEPSLALKARDDEGFKDADLMLFDKLIVFDNFRQRMTVIAHAGRRRSYEEACAEIERMIDLVRNGRKRDHVPARLMSGFRPLFSEERYFSMVDEAKRRIRELEAGNEFLKKAAAFFARERGWPRATGSCWRRRPNSP